MASRIKEVMQLISPTHRTLGNIGFFDFSIFTTAIYHLAAIIGQMVYFYLHRERI